MSIELGIGVSSVADIFAAGRQAAEEAVAHLAGRIPELTLVFSSVRFADPRLLKGIRSVTRDAPLIGCTDAGGITTAGPRRSSVTVIALVTKNVQLRTAVIRDVSRDSLSCGQRLGQVLKPKKGESAKALLVFPDGLNTNGSDLLRGLRKSLGNTLPVVGGAAADDFYFQKTFQYFNDEILTDSVPGVLLCGEAAVGIGVRHGWIPLGRPHTVTRSAGKVIYQLDREPAIAIYEDYLGIKRKELMQEGLAAVAMTYPLGTPRGGSGEYQLHDVIRAANDGSLISTSVLAQGSPVQLMIGGYESALVAARDAALQAARQVGSRRLIGALVFCSVARQRMLGSEFHGEIDVIRHALGGSGVRVGGFYGYGELAPWSPAKTRKNSAGIQNGFHNESVVVVGLG